MAKTVDVPIRMKVQVSFDKDDGLWYADCLDLQGCHTFGETKEQALENIVDVISDRLYAGLQMAKQDMAKKAPKRSRSWGQNESTEIVEITA